MAGEVQHPFSLSFQVEALHSSSISFGRFDIESLSWERRSSFSHNRYLEEVEKYAKPGSVTEKKAYFEAHFKKRALLRQTSSISQAEREGSNSDSSSYDTSICEENHRDSIHGEEPQQMVENGNICHFNESPKGSSRDGDVGVFEYEAGLVKNLISDSHTESLPSINDISVKCSSLAGDFCGGEYDINARGTDCLKLKQELNLDIPCSVENVKCNENVETQESESTREQDSMCNVQRNVKLGSEFSDQTPDVLKEQGISERTARGMIDQHSMTLKSVDKIRSSGLGLRPDGDVSLTCEREVKKGIPQTNGWREKQTPIRVRAQKQMPESVVQAQQSSVRQSKNPQNLKPKSPHEKRSSEKDMRPKRAVTPQPSTPERSESRRRRPVTSSTRPITSTRREIGQSVMNSSFRSTGGEQKKREKIMAADIRQLPRNPELKENQKLCSVSKPVLRLSSREKPQVVASSRPSATTSNKTLQSENRMTRGSKPSTASGVQKVVPPSKSAVLHFSSPLERGNDGSSSTRSCVMEANQRKEVVRKKERADERKPKARDNSNITKGKFVEATLKDGLGRSAQGFLRKSMGHSSAGGVHHSVTIKETPKVGPSGRVVNAFLRKSMGH